ncbi:MAG: leucine--tRNA ligase [Chloroflexota bacterium]
MAEKYTPQQIEPKWQARWDADKLYRATIDPSRPKHYALTMLPYPSGNLHIGHWYAMSPSDARARWMRMRGYNVLFPMGFDAFGLPAENAAIQRNIHPKTWTYANIEKMRTQMKTMGTMFDWDREAISSDPKYYKWTQWFFLKFYENGLAYKQMATVDFCPHCNTTLAREQVWGDDRHCERCGTPVIKKDLEQWFFRTTKYAEELQDHSQINWPERVKTMQKNWVGQSEGAHVTFKTEQGDDLTIFTTRPDTLWGATFMVLAPEHPLVEKLTSDVQRTAVAAYIDSASRQTEIERTDTNKEKTGVFTGGYAINPVNNARVPVWVADYVLMGYGMGAIMAVPAHDERDFAFARKFDLPVRVVIQPEGEVLDGDTLTEAYHGDGKMVNSGAFDGTHTDESVAKVTAWLDEQGMGHYAVNYRLRDWLISRQRYWGAPIPIVYCANCGAVPVPYDQLPVVLPDDVQFMPTGESPLKFHAGFLNTTCPTCGGPAKRETDTMDTFMCSSWYHLRYLSPDYDEAPFDPQEGAYWLPVDQYTGGIEHATMHLMYTRFFTKALRDCGIWKDTEALRQPDQPSVANEPMLALFNQGMILGEAREGDIVIASGTVEADRLNAASIRIVTDVVETTGANEVSGEITKRTENLLNINTPQREMTVEVYDTTKIMDVNGNAITLADLRYHLDAEKMSKSKGNVVAPDQVVAKYGADTVRGYLMFAFRWESGGPWDSQGIQGIVRWLNDVWTLVTGDKPAMSGEADEAAVKALRRKVHQTIQKVTDGLDSFGFNTAVAGLMELKNTLLAARKTPVVNTPAYAEAISSMLLMMAPFTPFIAEELWERTGHPYSIHTQQWPVYDPEIAKADEITLVVQVNGKVRDRITVPADISEADAKALALSSESIQRYFNGEPPSKVFYVPTRGMVNIVV